MTDARLRELERRYLRSGSPEAHAAWRRALDQAGALPHVGVVWLPEDPWDAPESEAWARRSGRSGDRLPPTTAPPPVCVAVGDERLTEYADWLALAEHLVVVHPEIGDPELRHLVQEELAQLDPAATLTYPDSPTPTDLDGAVERALEVAASLPARTWRWTPAVEATEVPAVPPGPWLELEVDLAHRARATLTRQLCRPPTGPALLDLRRGTLRDLRTGATSPVPGLEARAFPPVAAGLPGDRWLDVHVEVCRWVRGGHATRDLPSPRGPLAIGVDPWERVAWRGYRCRFEWLAPVPGGFATWRRNVHDWPHGHAKKLYGYEDNTPLGVQLSCDAEASLSLFEHDALVTPGLPLRWRADAHVAWAERGPLGALLFQVVAGGRAETWGADPLEADEDARDGPPVVVLGPSPDARYAVGFAHATYRLLPRAERAALLGGPAQGWALYDAEHTERRRGPERLLAGWDRWLVLERDGQLLRLNLLDDAVEELGPTEGPIDDALPLPGTPNVVLRRGVEADVQSLRVV
ncbi:MAG: hypothetical protein R3F62_17150 [Planctomycetota bacterium]